MTNKEMSCSVRAIKSIKGQVPIIERHMQEDGTFLSSVAVWFFKKSLSFLNKRLTTINCNHVHQMYPEVYNR